MYQLTYNGLRPYQDEAIQVILEKKEIGLQRQLVHLPTGTGKTIIIANLLNEIEGRVLILTHRQILVQQTKEKILLVNPEANIGIIQGKNNDVNKEILVASVPTIGKQRQDILQKDRLLDIPTDIKLVIVDEAHHSIAQTWRRVFQYLGLIEEQYYPSNDIKDPTRSIKVNDTGAALVGFTATPYRTDRAPLKQVYDEVVYHKPIFDFIPEYLSDCLFANIEQELMIDGESTLSSEITQSELNSVLKRYEAKKLILDTYQEHCGDRRFALGFAINIEEAENFANIFSYNGISSSVVHSGLKKEILDERFEDFKNGKIKVLWNVNMLTEGFDFAPIDLLLICRALPTRKGSSDKEIENDGDLIFTQIIGRGTRISETKKNCLILDFGALLSIEARQEMLSRTADLFGIEPKHVDLEKSAEEHKEEAKKRYNRKREIHYGKLKLTQLMDTQRADRYSKKEYSWISTYHAYHLLTLNQKQSFKVIITNDSKLKYDVIYRDNYIDTILADQLELNEAVLFVEQYIEDNNLSIRLIDPEQQWLKLPATSAQKYALQKRKINYDANIKRGDASHLITKYDIEITPLAQNLEEKKDKEKEILGAYKELIPEFKEEELLHLIGILDQGLSLETKEAKYNAISYYTRYRAIYKALQELVKNDFQDISEYFVNSNVRSSCLQQGLLQLKTDLEK